ncbi:hypothetical protein KFE25_002441 [Diacronema lutheri]|uniref:Homeobox domain-containing protein n=2 Tax=Diacronema lutheri TaxID=2081491 RepID=A0A8J5XHR6_DIALT|nr:hypothetical protein KFE25_002441 [Diacronema lutheri]
MSDADLHSADTAAPDDAPNSRSRWRVSVHETNVLEAVFASSPRPNKNTIHQLATMLGVKPRQVQVWFQNRRQRWRKDFLELERARSMQLAELSGKVIDFHGDLLLPLPTGAGGADAGALSMPVGWERLLLAPSTPPPAAPALAGGGAECAAPAPAPPAHTPPLLPAVVAAPAAEAVAFAAPAEHARAVKAEIETLNDIDLHDLLNFAPAHDEPTRDSACAQHEPPQPPPPLVCSRENSLSLSLNGSPLNGSPNAKSSSTADESADDSMDTIWLGMEWLVADSHDLAVN